MKRHPMLRVAVLSFLSSLLPSCGDDIDPSRDAGSRDAAVAAVSQALATPVTVTLNSTADTNIRQPSPTFNYGTASTIKVTGSSLSSWEAGLVKFDPAAIQAAVGTGTLQSATLQLTISNASLGWGGSQVSIHRMTKAWTETGATWLCANDTDHSLLGRFINNCAAQDLWGIEWWSFLPRPYAEPASATINLPFGQQGAVSATVTADVQAVLSGTPHQGWILTSTASLAQVWVQFSSREGNVVPKLVLSVIPACTPVGPDTTCNGVDDDCDTRIDEAYAGTTSSCGVGACVRSGTRQCVGGIVTDNCQPGTPAPSDPTCNGIDDNCNGVKDEGYTGVATSCGVGACANTGTSICVNGTVTPNCSPRPPPASSDVTCDRVDDDCSGAPDEDYPATTIACGVGACQRSGIRQCSSGQVTDLCEPGDPAPSDTTCDGEDDDCNGQEDEGYLPAQTSCTLPGCLAHGSAACSGGQSSDDCETAGVCYFETNCADGVDNDIDGSIDCIDDNCAGTTACTSSVPDPRSVAPITDRTHFASTFELAQFLFNGPDPIQLGVTPGAIPPARFGVTRGRVLSAATGAPLRDVRVSVLDQPQFGYTVTRADGQFDLALNGGVRRQLVFSRDGYLPVQRPVQVNWDTFDSLEDVALTPLDPTVETIDMSGSPTSQIMRGSVQTDADGTRQPTLIFPAGVGAQLVMPNGTVQALGQMNLRVTEFSVAGLGTMAMPAQLPADSNAAYVASFDAEEAVASGAKSVQFSASVPLYLENFLGREVGAALGARTYDPGLGVWVSSVNGRVVKIVGITGGAADLDIDGDDIADSPAVLAALGISNDERAKLTTLYAPGASLMRVPLNHFTTVVVEPCPQDPYWHDIPDRPGWEELCLETRVIGELDDGRPVEGGDSPPEVVNNDDLANLNGQSVPDNTGQGNGEPLDTPVMPSGDDSSAQAPDAPIDDPCGKTGGSTIAVENGTLREDVPIAGTPFTLNYASNRAQTAVRRGLEFTVPVSDGSARADTYRGATVRIEVGGQVLTRSLAANSPELQVSLTWDGLNAYGREMVGATRAVIETCYLYDAPHRRDPVSLCSSYVEQVTPFLSTAFGPDGWMLSAQHVYDTTGRVLTRGNGQQTSASGRPHGYVITNVYSRSSLPWEDGRTNLHNIAFTGFLQVADGDMIAFGPSVQSGRPVLFRLAPKTTFPGDHNTFGADPSTYWSNQTWVETPRLFAGPNGTLYVHERQRKPDNTIRDEVRRYSLDASKQLVQLGAVVASNVRPIASDAEGNFYARGTGGQLLRYAPDGASSLVYESPNFDAMGRNNMTVKGRAPGTLMGSMLVTVGPDGTIYVVEQWGTANLSIFGTLYSLPPNGGRIELLNTAEYEAGNPDIAPNDSIGVTAMTVDPTTNRVTMGVGFNARIVQVIPRRVLTLVGENFGNVLVLGPRQLWSVVNMAYGPDGLLYFSERIPVNAIRRVEPNYPGEELLPSGTYRLPSEDGKTVFYFDAGGRQIETRDAASGDPIYTFGYTGGWLTSITDRFGKQTRIERDGSGNLQRIVAPFGQTTTIDLNGAGQIERVTAPDTTAHEFEYDGRGMMKTLKNPREFTAHHTFDPEGKLSVDTDNAGATQNFTRTGLAPVTVNTTSGENVPSSYGFERTTGGLNRVVTFGDGTKNESSQTSGGAKLVTRADGTTITSTDAPDPVWGMAAQFAQQVKTVYPSGRTSQATITRTAAPLDALQPFGPANRTETTVLNGRTTTQSFNATTRTLTITSPQGRITTASRNAAGTLLQVTPSGRATERTTLDAQGRPNSITLDDGSTQRTTTFTYDPVNGYLSSKTGPIPGETHTFTNDSFGRVTLHQNADGKQTQFSFDDVGNLSSETPPERSAHGMDYTPIDLIASYRAPDLAGGPVPVAQLDYTYTLDRNTKHVFAADGQDIEYVYGPSGKVDTRATERGSDQFLYDPQSGKLASILSDNGRTLAYAYDGDVTTSTSWAGSSGQINGSVSMTRDANSWVSSVQVNGVAISAFARDNDGLITASGPLQITRDPASGDITATQLGMLTTSESTNRFGELTGYASAVNGSPLFSNLVTLRDAAGRIVDRTESVQGTSHAYHYVYDRTGRLTDVSVDGAIQTRYEYDANGNRKTLTQPSATLTGTYDTQDRLSSYGPYQYTYSAVGALNTKTNTATGAATTYDYDSLGNLRSVQLPDGRNIEYEIDARNRRVGKSVNGTRSYGLLYAGQLNPVAQLAADNSVIATFVYATRPQVPDYMRKGGDVYRFLVDQLGSVRLVVNVADGSVAQRITYDEFGNVVNDSNPGFQPFGFAGGLHDPDTGLTRFGARDYDAVTGRWTAKDAILFGGGQANLYVYVSNDPVNRIDPSGLYDYTAEDTQQLLDQAVDEYKNRNTVCALGDALENNSANGRATGKYDFRFKNSDDTFDVPGVGQLTPADFGNYFAGYVNYSAFGEAGYAATRAGGSYMETLEHGTFGDDPHDIDLIQRGAYDVGRGN
jgi:RHS repeat-associated protein